tara:strand:- start:5331 stop:5819 length:489 start_codon:yes stop_codon:yes gene_type:complete
MVTKKFNPSLYSITDFVGKNVVSQYYMSVGLKVSEGGKYDIDLLLNGISKDGIKFNNVPVEVEYRMGSKGKEVWNGKTFKYTTVHVPYRKKKFVTVPNMLYAVVNKNCDLIITCEGSVIKECPVKEIKNTAVSNGEYFYDVPIKKWKRQHLPINHQAKLEFI